MKTNRFLVGAAVIALVLAASCVPPSLQTPQGQAAYVALPIVQALAALQNAAIQANDTADLHTHQPLISTDTTRKIVRFTVGSTKTIQEGVRAGWVSSVVEGYAQLKLHLSADERSKLQIYLAAIDVALEVYRVPEGGQH